MDTHQVLNGVLDHLAEQLEQTLTAVRALQNATIPEELERFAALQLVARHRAGDDRAVAELHRTGLWRALEFSSWRSFCVDELGISRPRAYQLVDLDRVRAILDAAGGLDMSVSLTEGQARPLVPLLDDEVSLRRAWMLACERAGPGASPTAEQVRLAVEQLRPSSRAESS